MEFVWDDKGIVLGIIYHITKYNQNVSLSQDDYINDIIKYLFPSQSDGKASININIKNNIQEGIIINNIKNLDSVCSDRVYLLPWSNKENPLIMFEFNKDKKTNKDKLLKKVDYFDENLRGNWDEETEHKILEKYIKLYPNRFSSVDKLNEYISNKLISQTGYKVIPKHIPIPIKVDVPYPVYQQVPYIVNNNEMLDKCKKTVVDLNKIIEDKDKKNKEATDNLVECKKLVSTFVKVIKNSNEAFGKIYE